MSDYIYLKREGKLKAFADLEVQRKLEAGVYTFEGINIFNDTPMFKSMTNVHDHLVDIPSSEYDRILSEMQHFLKPETTEKFKEFGFIKKRSALLYGGAGTGKTSIVNRVAQEVVKSGGIVLFNPAPSQLSAAYDILDSTNKGQLVLVIFEEFDNLIQKQETALLNILDGEIQRENVMYLATTNHIEKIPDRVKRVGRFSSTIEVGLPSQEALRYYLETKVSKERAEEISMVTAGFTIDDLKEVVLATECLGIPLFTVVNKIKRLKNL